MQKDILIIKPYGLASNTFMKFLEDETNHKLFCVEKLEKDFNGIMIFCKSKDDLKKYKNKKNEYIFDFLLKNETNLQKLKNDLKIFFLNKKDILSFKMDFYENSLKLKLSTWCNYKIYDFMKFFLANFNDIKKIQSATRAKNCGIELGKCISIDDLWMFSKNIILINENNIDIKNVKNLVIGEFDLIHKGHGKLLVEKDISILTFINNPSKKLPIFNDSYKINQLKKFKPKEIFIYDISRKNILAEEFIKMFLIKMDPKKIIVGSDFKFGTDAKGDINLLKKYFNVEIIKRDEKYSTTKIKELIIKNKYDYVNRKLYSDFLFEGIIIRGKQLGRKLGFPTANIIMKTNFPFTNGSYYSNAIIDDKFFNAMTFISSIENGNILIETFIFDFNKNIYGKKIKIIPKAFIRKKQKFKNIDSLIHAIKKDETKAKELIKNANK